MIDRDHQSTDPDHKLINRLIIRSAPAYPHTTSPPLLRSSQQGRDHLPGHPLSHGQPKTPLSMNRRRCLPDFNSPCLVAGRGTFGQTASAPT